MCARYFADDFTERMRQFGASDVGWVPDENNPNFPLLAPLNPEDYKDGPLVCFVSQSEIDAIPQLKKQRADVRYNQGGVPYKANSGGEYRCHLCTHTDYIVRSGNADHLEKPFLNHQHDNAKLKTLMDGVYQGLDCASTFLGLCGTIYSSRLDDPLHKSFFDSVVTLKLTDPYCNDDIKDEFFALLKAHNINVDGINIDHYANKEASIFYAKGFDSQTRIDVSASKKSAEVIWAELLKKKIDIVCHLLQAAHATPGAAARLIEFFTDKFPALCSEETDILTKHRADDFRPKRWRANPAKSDAENLKDFGCFLCTMRPGKDGGVGGYINLLSIVRNANHNSLGHFTSIAARSYDGKMYFDYFDPLAGRTQALSLEGVLAKVSGLVISSRYELLMYDVPSALELVPETAALLSDLRHTSKQPPVISRISHSELKSTMSIKEWCNNGLVASQSATNQVIRNDAPAILPSSAFVALSSLERYGATLILRLKFPYDSSDFIIKRSDSKDPPVYSVQIINVRSNGKSRPAAAEQSFHTWDSLLLYLWSKFDAAGCIEHSRSDGTIIQEDCRDFNADVANETNKVFANHDIDALFDKFMAKSDPTKAKWILGKPVSPSPIDRDIINRVHAREQAAPKVQQGTADQKQRNQGADIKDTSQELKHANAADSKLVPGLPKQDIEKDQKKESGVMQFIRSILARFLELLAFLACWRIGSASKDLVTPDTSEKLNNEGTSQDKSRHSGLSAKLDDASSEPKRQALYKDN